MPSAKRLLCVALITVVTVLVMFLGFQAFETFVYGQAKNLRLAERHADSLRPRIAAQPRFKDIDFSSFTGGPGPGGCFSVTGSVRTEADALELAKIVVDSNPDVPIYWVVSIDELRFSGSQRVILERPFKMGPIEAQISEAREMSDNFKPDPKAP